MIGRAFAVIAAVGIFVGLSTPDGEEKRTPESKGEQDFSRKSDGKASRYGRTRDISNRKADVTLRRRYDGHFYADVMVNGRNVEFMIDTGATGIALTRRDAENLGLFWNENELETVGRGVSGAVTGKMVRLEQVELGGKEVRDIDAAIIPGGLDVSLLGQSFLSRFGEVKITGDEMTLN